MKTSFSIFALVFALVLGQSFGAFAETQSDAASEDALAKQLANPVASLISVPFQNNFDFGIGAHNGWRYTLNVQPVIPFSLSEHWNLISRTIARMVSFGVGAKYYAEGPSGGPDWGMRANIAFLFPK
jgi:hypothetical protein